MTTCWMTVEYLGQGFVLQRKQSGSSFATEYDEETRQRISMERIIHVDDTNNIDTSTIDTTRLQNE